MRECWPGCFSLWGMGGRAAGVHVMTGLRQALLAELRPEGERSVERPVVPAEAKVVPCDHIKGCLAYLPLLCPLF